VEIVPILVPAIAFDRMQGIAAHLGDALAAAIKKRSWSLGRDVAVVMSTDGTHYGSDFRDTRFGAGGVQAYEKALAQDRAWMRDLLAGPISVDKARAFYASATNPDNLEDYRSSWCGRFSVPFGLLLLGQLAKTLARPAPKGVPLALSTSVGVPEIKVRELGLGPTAPANLYHFVMHPALAFE
jgi:AmmeMemoRadiSam system protein B